MHYVMLRRRHWEHPVPVPWFVVTVFSPLSLSLSLKVFLSSVPLQWADAWLDFQVWEGDATQESIYQCASSSPPHLSRPHPLLLKGRHSLSFPSLSFSFCFPMEEKKSQMTFKHILLSALRRGYTVHNTDGHLDARSVLQGGFFGKPAPMSVSCVGRELFPHPCLSIRSLASPPSGGPAHD